jgi:hypothetical protein
MGPALSQRSGQIVFYVLSDENRCLLIVPRSTRREDVCR